MFRFSRITQPDFSALKWRAVLLRPFLLYEMKNNVQRKPVEFNSFVVLQTSFFFFFFLCFGRVFLGVVGCASVG